MIGDSGISSPQFFIGVVENNVDKTHEGKIQVRAFGVHGTHSDIATQDLPWAICASGSYDPNNPPPPLNSFVYGMFLDGRMAQHPLILGLIPGMYNKELNPIVDGYGVIAEENGDLLAQGYSPRDFNASGGPDRLSRAEDLLETYLLSMAANKVHDQKIGGEEDTWSEPGPSYAAKYPYNRVIKTANHSIELDDSPGAERITIHHRAGSYIEIDSKGTVAERAQGDRYEVNIGTKHESSGHSVVTINGNAHVYVKGNKTEEIEGDYKQIVHGNAEYGVGGQFNINGGDQVQIRGADVVVDANVGTASLHAEKEVRIEGGAQIQAKAQNVNITSLLDFQLYATKSMKITTLLDFHCQASNHIFTSTGLVPPNPLNGAANPAGVGFSITAPAMHILSATGSFSGIWNAGTLNGAIVTGTTGNFTTLNATGMSATTGVFGTASAAVLLAAAYTGPIGSTAAIVPPPTISIPTLPLITAPATSVPILGFALPNDGSGRAKMPEPPSKNTSIMERGYFSLGYALGYLAPTDDTAKDGN